MDETTDELLVPLLADGSAGPALAVVRASAPIPQWAGPGSPFVRRALAAATAESLAADLAAGAAGVLVTGLRDPSDVERLSTRLSVAEAMAGVADGSTAVVALVETAGLVATLRGLIDPRLTGLGIDTAAVAASIGLPPETQSGAALSSARGQVVIAAAAAGVPAFERLASRPDAARLAAVRADGFAWVLVPPIG